MERLDSIDIPAMCRLCARCDEKDLLDLFAPQALFHLETPLIIDMVYESTSVKITASDELPTKVCGECCKQVETLYNFKKKCLLSDALFKQQLRHLRASKQEVYQPETPAGDDSILNSSGDNYQRILNPGPSEQTLIMNENPEYDFEILKVEIKEEDDAAIESFISKSSMSDNEVSPTSECTKSIRVVDAMASKRSMGLPRRYKFPCRICWRSFANKYSLSRHQLSHNIKTILRCKYCLKEFKNHESWFRHERMHSGDNPYQCSMCRKSYTSSTAYAAHVRKHTGETPYSCSDCNENFQLASSYERHVARHRGVKEFKCEICSSSFWVRDDLRAHVNRIH